jgi:hypothetical protein
VSKPAAITPTHAAVLADVEDLQRRARALSDLGFRGMRIRRDSREASLAHFVAITLAAAVSAYDVATRTGVRLELDVTDGWRRLRPEPRPAAVTDLTEYRARRGGP